MLKRKRKNNIISLATFLLTFGLILTARGSASTWWIGEPQLPKKMK